jgi:hypothetical protein
VTAVDAPRAEAVGRLSWRRFGALVLVAAVPLAAYGSGVLLPYYVNDLDALPLDDVAGGAYDPKDLWPSGTWWGPWLRLLGILVGSAAPSALLLTGLAATVYAVRGALFSARRRRAPVMVAALVALAVACWWGATWFLGPTAAALSAWVMD